MILDGVAPVEKRQDRCNGVGSGVNSSKPWEGASKVSSQGFASRSGFTVVKLRSRGLAYSKREEGWAVLAQPYRMEVFPRTSFLPS